MTHSVSFTVPGLPQSQGSLRAFVRGDKAILTSTNTKLRAWRADVRTIAADHIPQPWDGPVYLDLIFYFPRPKSHFGTGKNANRLKDTAPSAYAQMPDLDKLCRASFDALAGVAYHDDKQVYAAFAGKYWGPTPETVFYIDFLN